MDITSEKFLDNYNDLAIQELKDFSGDGKVYAVPTNAFSLGVWVNKDMFEKYYHLYLYCSGHSAYHFLSTGDTY